VSGPLERQAFDSDAFGIPWYRVVDVTAPALAAELERLESAGPHAIDAKLPAEALDHARLLQGLGFRRICTQFELKHPLAAATQAVTGVAFSDELALPDDLLWRHAGNFRSDRFSQDPLLPEDGVRTLYRRWIGNSLSGRKQVAHDGRNFCTYAERPSGWSIDLVSVLDPGQGVGTRLLAALIARAGDRGAPSFSVVTECENPAAWRLYLKSGFTPSCFVSVFHKVAR
jgi:GNAT superfamily N-acetyltransferase